MEITLASSALVLGTVRAMVQSWPHRVTRNMRNMVVDLKRDRPTTLDADASAVFYLLARVA